jgi:tetratricopeptide (TPR) repeat protein
MNDFFRKCTGPALFVITLVVFARAFKGEFLNYDDPLYVTQLAEVREGLSWSNARWALSATHAANWHPLTWWSLQLDASIHGLQPAGFHLANVLLHAGCVWLLYVFLESATGAWWPSTLAAAIFGWHPLRAESVAWISERKDVLSMFLGLLALLAYARYVRKRSWRGYLAVTIFFALALAAKPMMVTLPFLMLLLDYWPLGRGGAQLPYGRGSERKTAKSSTHWLGLVLEKLPWVLLSALSCRITLAAQASWGATRSRDQLALLTRVAHAIVSYAVYIGKFFWPSDLVVFYPFTSLSWEQGSVQVSLVCLIVLSAAAWMLRRRCPYLIVGWCWYLIALLPVIGLVQVGNQSLADRYTYLPSIGLAVAVAWLLSFLRLWLPAAGNWIRVFAIAWLLVLVSLTWKQLGYWHDSVALWQHAEEVVGANSTIELNLGSAFAAQHRIDLACDHFLTALRLNPQDDAARTALEITVSRLALPREALNALEAAVKRSPADPYAHYALGLVLAGDDQTEEAVNEYRTALRFMPDCWPAHERLAVGLRRLGHLEEAQNHESEAARLKPPHPMTVEPLLK